MRRLRVVAALLAAVSGLLAPSAASAGVQALHVYESPQFEEWQQEENDCMFAAAAAWEADELGLHPTVGQVFSAYWEEGHEYSLMAFSNYWSHHPIDGVRARVLAAATPSRKADPSDRIVTLEPWQLPQDAQWRSYYKGVSFTPGEGHAVLWLKYTRHGVLVVSWGLIWELSTAEWQSMSPEYYAVQRLH